MRRFALPLFGVAIVSAVLVTGFSTTSVASTQPSPRASAASKPAITAVSPHRAHSGERIIVTGRHLNMATAVLVHGKRAKFLVKSRTKLAVVVPKKATTGRITIRAGKLHTTSAHPLTVTPPNPPATSTINNFTPTSGPYGTTVTINGSGFTSPCDTITIGAAQGPCTYVSTTQVTANIPAGATTGPISIFTGNSLNNTATNGTSTTSFRVTLGVGLSTTTGPPGTATTVYGAGFGANEQVDIYDGTTDLGIASSDGAGNFAHPINTLSSDQPGADYISATGKRTGTSAQQTFNVNTNWTEKGFNSSGDNYNPYENTIGVNNVSRLGERWLSPTGTGSGGTPVVANGVVYVGGFNDKLYAFNAATGAAIGGSFPVSTTAQIEGSPAVANGVVYVASNDHKLYAYNATTGMAIGGSFPVSTGNAIEGSPTVANGVVYVGSDDDKLYAFNAATGAAIGGSFPVPTSGVITGSPAVVNGVVYFGSQDDKLYAVNASTGVANYGFPINVGAPIKGSPAVSNGIVYVADYSGTLSAYDAEFGDPETGFPVTTDSTGGNPISGSPAVANGIVYVAGDNGDLYAYDAFSGTPISGFPTVLSPSQAVYGAPTVANGVVYVPSDRGIFAFNATTGVRLYESDGGDGFAPFDGEVSIANGIVYAGGEDGYLYAFGLNGMNTQSGS